MERFQQLVGEIHRRSIWQVLSVYLVASWVALQVVEIVTESAGLPDWAQPFALILLIIGLPIVLATAVVQEGLSGPSQAGGEGESSTAHLSGTTGGAGKAGEAGQTARRSGSEGEPAGTSGGNETPRLPGTRRLFTWRNAIGGGIAAFALLGLLVAGYFVMWSSGIGPVGSLSAQGVFDEGDAVVLSQFQNTSNDETLGDMVTEALRVDLAGSSIMTLVEPLRVRDALRRMGRTGEERLDADLAREVAIRDGFKAVIQGTVGSAGSGYIFTASLVAAESGAPLATFRETARGPDEVIDAIDKLSQDIREKAGESLRVIRAEEPLEDVTTSSLGALRLYAEADRLAEQAEYPRAIAALREALDLDPSFAMAYRRLAVLLQNSGGALADQVEATTRAYELRNRLTERERYLAVAYYHNLVTLDLDAEIQAYQTVLERYPDDAAALNNIALALLGRTRLDEALDALDRAVNGPGASAPAFTNYPGYLAMAGRHQDAEEALARMEARYPGRDLWVVWNRFNLAAFRGDGEAAAEAGRAMLSLPEAQGRWRAAGYLALAVGDVIRGRFQSAEEHNADAIEEMKALGLWDQVQIIETSRITVNLLAGRQNRAELEYAQMDLHRILDSIPPPARSYEVVVPALARLGNRSAVTAMLDRWKADAIPSATAPVFGEVQRDAQAVLLSRTDPVAGLRALDALSVDLDCKGCAVWERAVLAQEVGELQEARELFESIFTLGSEDYLGGSLMRVLARERLGEVLEALGEPGEAAEQYLAFAEAWAEADEGFQPRVSAARERAAALGSDGS